MYGDEGVVPLELEIPSLDVSLYGLILDADRRKSRLAELEVLDEESVNVLEHLCAYHSHIQWAYIENIISK